MNKTQEALNLALEALEKMGRVMKQSPDTQKAITAIREALAEQPAQQDMPKIGCVNHDCDKCKAQQQEPVAWRWENGGEDRWVNKYIYLDNGGPDCPEDCEPLYTSPPASKPWVGLTDEEAAATAYKGFDEYWTEDCKGSETEAWAAAARAIEAKLREKNA